MSFLPLALVVALFPAPGGAVPGRPYHGTPAAIPGGIEAEDFDRGGEGVAWHDTTRGNEHRTRDRARGEGIRTDSDVDIQPCSEGGLGVGWFRAGEWMAYTVEAPEAVTCSVEFRVASDGWGGVLHAELDGKPLTGPVKVPDTGGYQSWASVVAGTVPIPRGRHILRVVGDREGRYGMVANINSMDFFPEKGLRNTGLARARFRDPSRPLKERVADLLSRMTLSEKVSQMGYLSPPIPRLGIPAYEWWGEGVHGAMAKGATVFPHAIGLASTWNPALVRRVAEAVADEARALFRKGGHSLTYWCPVINLARDPRWGRTQECYGEDPWLTGRLGLAFIRGLQGDDPRRPKVIATPKHYAMNSYEGKRNTGSSNVDERLMREYYLPQFRECLKPGGALSVMCAYNAVNGEPCCTNKVLLEGILRREWGFKGYVLSDCWALNDLVTNRRLYASLSEAAAAALEAGVDLDCGRTYQWNLTRAVRRGLVEEDAVDRALSRLLEARFRLGLFDPPGKEPWRKVPASELDSPAHRELALGAARESIVLLRNSPRVLPFRAGLRRIAVSGRLAAVASLGNYSGTPSRTVSPLEGIRRVAGAGTVVIYTATREGGGQDRDYAARAADDARRADAAVVVAGTSLEHAEEGRDMADLDLPAGEEALVRAVALANRNTVLVLVNGNPLAIRWAAENVPAILEAWYSGQEGGTAVAEVLFGKYNPGGKLPITFPRSAKDLPPIDDYDIRKGRTYMYPRKAPLFPFGHGLSYTTFRMGPPRLSARRISPDGKVTVTVEVRNTGTRRGDEVAQLYLSRPPAGADPPARVLRGAKRLGLGPGEARKVEFTLAFEELSSLDDSLRPVVLPGKYLVMAGPSSATGLTSSFVVGGK